MSADIRRIPNFIKAGSPRRLRELMLITNARLGMQHKWYDIQYVATENKWYAWFSEVADTSKLLAEAGVK